MKNSYSHQQNHIQNMHLVLKILGWSEDQYSHFQYECGLKYLESYLPQDQTGQKILEGQRMFWNWWKNHWYARDEEFIAEVALTPRSLAIETYYFLNDAIELAADIHPSRTIVGEQFATEKI